MEERSSVPSHPIPSKPTPQIPPQEPPKPVQKGHPPKTLKTINYKHKKKKSFEEVTFTKTPTSSLSSSASSSYPMATQGTRVPHKRRHPKVLLGALPRHNGSLRNIDVEAIALPLGMSFAAVVAQVLERKDASGERLSADHLSMICTSAVRESLANVFGDKFDLFSSNFGKSFGSTLRTLRLINESSQNSASSLSHLNADCSASDTSLGRKIGVTSFSNTQDCHSQTDLSSLSIPDHVKAPVDKEEDENVSGENHGNELDLHGQINQLICAPSLLPSVSCQLNTFEKSVIEQSRSNELKAMEIGLTMRRLKLKEAQLAVSYDSNHLERSKLAMGVSKASFKAEKFKTQLEDTRHSELFKKVIDCLVAGLFIMSGSLSYAAFTFSYKRISEATASCNLLYENSKSWWMPKSFSLFNSGMHTLRCQVQVVSRMLFGMLMIIAIAYLLLQRSGTSKQTMPVTFVLLLLGVVCSFCGKLCVDTLGGSGIKWLVYWEIFCLLHFLSIVFTPTLFRLLYGPVAISQGMRGHPLFPYWFRRILFFAVLLVVLPLCCGFLPFANPSEWKNHLLLLASDFFISKG